MADVGSLDIKITIDTRQLRKAASNVNEQTGKMTKSFGLSAKGAARLKDSLTKLANVLKKAVVAGFALAATAAGKALQEFGKFEQRMSDISTLISGDSTQAIEQLSDGILEMTKRIPKTADDLGASAYQIMSAGITDAAEVLSVLENAGKLAVAGLSTTEEATDLLTTAINAFGLDAENSAGIADVLFQTVKFGKTDISKLSQAFGKMAGNASAANVSFEDVQAATAALTAVTGKTSEAQNALAQVFLEFTVAGGKLDKGLQDNGKSVDDLNDAISRRGLLGGMEEIRDEMELTDTEFKNLFSSAEGGTAVFQLLTSAADTYTIASDEMASSASALEEAFAKQNSTMLNQWQILRNNVTVALINLGDVMWEQITNIMPQIQEAWQRFREQFGLSDEELNNLAITIGEKLAEGILFLVEHLPEITVFFVGLWNIIKGIIITFQTLARAFVVFGEGIETIAIGIKNFFVGIAETIQQVIDKIKIAIGKVKNFFGIGGAEASAAGFVGAGASRADASGGIISKFAQGTDSVPTMLTPGEMVLNRRQQRNMFGALGGNTTKINNTFNNNGISNPGLIADLAVRRISQQLA